MSYSIEPLPWVQICDLSSTRYVEIGTLNCIKICCEYILKHVLYFKTDVG